VIRRATPEDVDAVSELEAAIFGPDGWTPAMVAEELTGERRHAFVTDDLTGYAVTMKTDDVVDLLRIAVAPAVRRRGVARALLDAAMAAAEGSRMLLEVSAANHSAIAFYASAGFAQIDRRRRYYKDGTDAIVMEATL
jgi:ribosomal-protein-alanine N-acetyltransferase